MHVELLVIENCPHHRQAAELLRQALDDIGLADIAIDTRVIASIDEATRSGFAGSPTILLNGHDPFPAPSSAPALACRIYATPAGHAGIPDLRELRRALKKAADTATP